MLIEIASTAIGFVIGWISTDFIRNRNKDAVLENVNNDNFNEIVKMIESGELKPGRINLDANIIAIFQAPDIGFGIAKTGSSWVGDNSKSHNCYLTIGKESNYFNFSDKQVNVIKNLFHKIGHEEIGDKIRKHRLKNAEETIAQLTKEINESINKRI